MTKEQSQKRNRLIALSFVSVLLMLVYGPLAQWFVAADRVLYDQLASHLRSTPLEQTIIISVDPAKADQDELVSTYGKIIAALKESNVRRIVLTEPPELSDDDRLPGWSATLNSSTPVYVPARHRFSDIATRDGFVDIKPDSDGVLRRSDLWSLSDGVMSPSLALAIAFDNVDAGVSLRLSSADDAIYLSNYVELPRVAVADLLNGSVDQEVLRGATVFVDSSPALVGAAALLPSGQFVTQSEITASLLANVEYDQVVIAPSWVNALEMLAPLLLAIVAVLFLPDRSRKDIAVLAGFSLALLLLIEVIMLYVLRLRIDLGRPILIFLGVALLCFWLVRDEKKETVNAFKRGSDFLSAGRLEPAFAEFRRCPPTEILATLMYKLSLAFEQQAKPERAEAVL